MILKQFYGDVNPRDPKCIILANFAAYLFCYVNWKIRTRQPLAKSKFQYCTNSERASTSYVYDVSNWSDDT